MRPGRVRSYKDVIPEDCEEERRCFVCDRQFRTIRSFQNHRDTQHDNVVIFNKNKQSKEKYDFRLTWEVKNFDDLFLSSKNKADKGVKAKRILKRKNVKKRCKVFCGTSN